MAKRCNACQNEIGMLSYKLEFKEEGKCLCKECAVKAGVADMNDFDGINFAMLREWINNPSKRKDFLTERERLREEKRKKEEEEKKKAELEAKELEKKRFPDGRVHVTIEQVSFTEFGAILGRGNTINEKVQQLQNKGCHIMNVSCFASGSDNKYVQAVIVYRATLE